jgi:hypothetical protein
VKDKLSQVDATIRRKPATELGIPPSDQFPDGLRSDEGNPLSCRKFSLEYGLSYDSYQPKSTDCSFLTNLWLPVIDRQGQSHHIAMQGPVPLPRYRNHAK